MLANETRSPDAMLAAWPADEPLAVLWSGEAGVSGESRWVVLARPMTVTVAKSVSEALEPLGRVMRAAAAAENEPPLTSGYIGALSYHLGEELEPAAAVGSRGDRIVGRSNSARGPLAIWARVEQAVAFDRRTGRWWSIGGLVPPAPIAAASVEMTRDAAAAFKVSGLTSESGAAEYQRAVARAVEYIQAGDVYQVNVAHALRAQFEGSPRALFAKLVGTAVPWFGGYLEAPGFALASASPELFLEVDPRTRRVRTRPMKGTRPAGGDVEELRDAAKDRAELNMITDLMRNDLGRVCAFGSMRVDEERSIERHGRAGAAAMPGEGAGAGPAWAGIMQATATVSGRLREGLTLPDVLRATFPPGSVTGAPKVRAMQIINELEPIARGFYCGCMGYVGDDGRAAFNVAIRTCQIKTSGEQGELLYHTGAGIVADSTPEEEWRETLVKAGPIVTLSESRLGDEPGELIPG
jgi:para-aminobenzoate synthetase component I